MICALLLALLTPAQREARFLELLRTYPERPVRETFAAVQALVDEGPFDGRDRALYWLASAELAAGERERGAANLARIEREYAASVWSERSWLLRGELAARDHDFGAALAWYGRAAFARDAAVRELAGIAAMETRALRTRQRAAVAAGAFAALVAAFFLWRGRRALWPPPDELRFMLPVLLLIAVAAAKVDPPPRAAIWEICAGGALLLWLSGARLRAAPPRPVAAHVALALAALTCLAYVAVYRQGLFTLLVETVRAGPE